jgi:transcriptional regulator with XRE-family HTH domain
MADSSNMPGGTFGANLSAARLARGWSQEQLGERAGIDQATVYRLEVGDRQPRLPTILVLAEAMGLSGSELIDGL